jgi:hypothetical protein
MTKLTMTVEKLFNYLETATTSIPKRYRKIALKSLAYYLIQWDSIPPNVIQAAISKCNEQLEGVCVGCYNELVSECEEGEEPLCNDCCERD